MRTLFALVPVATFWGGWLVGSRSPRDIRLAKLRQQTRLLRKARWASITRREGLANIYVEAAQRVLEIEE